MKKNNNAHNVFFLGLLLLILFLVLKKPCKKYFKCHELKFSSTKIVNPHIYEKKLIFEKFNKKIKTNELGFSYKKLLRPDIRIKIINNLPNQKLMPMMKRILNEKYNIIYDNEKYDLIYDAGYEDNDKITNYRGIKFFYASEATLPDLNNYDLVIGFNRIEDPRYIRIPYYYLTSNDKIKYISDKRSTTDKCNPHKKVFGCFLVSNAINGINSYAGNGLEFDGVKARNSIFEHLSAYKKIESGGKHANNIGYIVPSADTMSWLGRCKFIIAYENQTYEGYITEKPFNAYFAGSVPIWYGSRDAAKDINTKAVIYANDFKNEEELIEYIKKVDNDDDLYCKIWEENILKEDTISYDEMYEQLRNKLLPIMQQKFFQKDQ